MQIALEQLPINERIAIVEQIWDSIVQDYEKQKNEIPDSHKKLLDKRFDAYQNNQTQAEDYRTVMARLRQKFETVTE